MPLGRHERAREGLEGPPQLSKFPNSEPRLNIFTLGPFDAIDELDVAFRQHHDEIEDLLTNDEFVSKPSFIQAQLQARVSESESSHLSSPLSSHFKVIHGLLSAILNSTAPRPKLLDALLAVTRDGHVGLLGTLQRLCQDKWLKLHSSARDELLWLVEQLVFVHEVSDAEVPLLCIFRQMASADLSEANVRLSAKLLSSLENHREALFRKSNLLCISLFSFLRLLSDHFPSQVPEVQRLLSREVNFCVQVLRERFKDCLSIGRDLIRLLQDVAGIPEIQQIWADLLTNPASFGVPGFSDIEQLYVTRTPTRFITSRVTPEMEAQLRFLLSSVQMGEQRRYQTWFALKFLSAPESETLVSDLIRFICCAIHPTNAILQSNIMPRWAVIGWLLKCCRSPHVEGNAKLSLFYDWLFFSPQVDSIMNIEPAILCIYFSLSKYADLSGSLLEFLFLLLDHYDTDRSGVFLQGLKNAVDTLVGKGVVANLHLLSEHPQIPLSLRERVMRLFPAYCRVRAPRAVALTQAASAEEGRRRKREREEAGEGEAPEPGSPSVIQRGGEEQKKGVTMVSGRAGEGSPKGDGTKLEPQPHEGEGGKAREAVEGENDRERIEVDTENAEGRQRKRDGDGGTSTESSAQNRSDSKEEGNDVRMVAVGGDMLGKSSSPGVLDEEEGEVGPEGDVGEADELGGGGAEEAVEGSEESGEESEGDPECDSELPSAGEPSGGESKQASSRWFWSREGERAALQQAVQGIDSCHLLSLSGTAEMEAQQEKVFGAFSEAAKKLQGVLQRRDTGVTVAQEGGGSEEGKEQGPAQREGCKPSENPMPQLRPAAYAAISDFISEALVVPCAEVGLGGEGGEDDGGCVGAIEGNEEDPSVGGVGRKRRRLLEDGTLLSPVTVGTGKQTVSEFKPGGAGELQAVADCLLGVAAELDLSLSLDESKREQSKEQPEPEDKNGLTGPSGEVFVGGPLYKLMMWSLSSASPSPSQTIQGPATPTQVSPRQRTAEGMSLLPGRERAMGIWRCWHKRRLVQSSRLLWLALSTEHDLLESPGDSKTASVREEKEICLARSHQEGTSNGPALKSSSMWLPAYLEILYEVLMPEDAPAALTDVMSADNVHPKAKRKPLSSFSPERRKRKRKVSSPAKSGRGAATRGCSDFEVTVTLCDPGWKDVWVQQQVLEDLELCFLQSPGKFPGFVVTLFRCLPSLSCCNHRLVQLLVGTLDPLSLTRLETELALGALSLVGPAPSQEQWRLLLSHSVHWDWAEQEWFWRLATVEAKRWDDSSWVGLVNAVGDVVEGRGTTAAQKLEVTLEGEEGKSQGEESASNEVKESLNASTSIKGPMISAIHTFPFLFAGLRRVLQVSSPPSQALFSSLLSIPSLGAFSALVVFQWAQDSLKAVLDLVQEEDTHMEEETGRHLVGMLKAHSNNASSGNFKRATEDEVTTLVLAVSSKAKL